MNKRELHAVAALLLVFGGMAMIFTSSVEGAILGLVASLAAGGVMLIARNRPKS